MAFGYFVIWISHLRIISLCMNDGNVAELVFNAKSFLHLCLQITDGVVAAYILNATLIVPKLDQKSYWKDTRSAVILHG